MTIVFSRVTGGFVEEVDGQFLITVGDSQPGNDSAGIYGWDSGTTIANDGSGGSDAIDPDPPLLEGETLNRVYWSPTGGDHWEIALDGEGHPQTFWESVVIETSTGNHEIFSADADFFIDDSGGVTRWWFNWSSPTPRWGEDDEGIIRTVTFTIPEPV